MTESSGPLAAGVRARWDDMPAAVRQGLETLLGAPVVTAVTQAGGFSPGVAARLVLADGRRAFVKAVSEAANPDSPGIHRAEARIAAALPARVPAPRLLGSLDQDGWVALLFEDVEGWMPAQPWLPAELERVLAAVAELSEQLTPAPIPAARVQDRYADDFTGWRRLLGLRQLDAERGGAADGLADLDPWAAAHLDGLAALESQWGGAAAGGTLAHCDLRADNLLLTADGRVMIVDWPWAGEAAPWFDLLMLLPSIRMQGGPRPEEIFEGHRAAAGADPAAVTAVLAAFTGFLVASSRRPPPPGLPTLRAFQAAYGRAALDWLRTRTGWS